MLRAGSSVFAVLAVGSCVAVSLQATPPDREGEDRDRQNEQLLERIEALEEQVRKLQDRVPRRAATEKGQGRQEALEQYRRIDSLVAGGEIETANSTRGIMSPAGHNPVEGTDA